MIEILVVITIVVTLSGIGFIQFSKVQDRAEENIDYINATSIATAVNMASANGDVDEGDISLTELSEKGYISSIPKPESQEGEFSVNKTSNNVTVRVNGTIFYPRSIE